MMRFATSLESATRLTRASLIGLYAAIALLGPGGLHAIAPRGEANCCVAHPDAPTHRGCLHHHAHSQSQSQSPEDSPAPCRDKSCAICEFAATAAMPVAIVEAPPRLEAAEPVAPAIDRHVAVAAVSLFWIRGPPSAV